MRVTGGVGREVELAAKRPDAVLVRSGEQVKLRQEVEVPEETPAPVQAGDVLGKVTVYVDDSVLTEYDLVAAYGIEKMTFLKAFEILIGDLVNMC